VLLSSRAPIGYLAIAEIPVAVNQGFIAMICNGDLPNYYVLTWLHENMDTILGNANGTTFLEISKKNFRPIACIVPSPETLLCFIKLVDDLIESNTLAAMRDLLLPELLSGNLRVKEIPCREGI
jgi:type I restriction enzyme S subunit